MQLLSRRSEITYFDFLKVHEILFKDFFPWAGQDRPITAPNLDIHKGATKFAQPNEIKLAIDYGLKLAQQGRMATEPGRIISQFAFAHPFLDGNGRTIMLVHGELCFRAGMSIGWGRTDKSLYLSALSQEIDKPNGGHLDRYLKNFIGPKVPRSECRQVLERLPGLDGAPASPAADMNPAPIAKLKLGPGL